MTLFSVFFGASCGVGLQLFSNAIRKMPLARDPFIHLAFGGVGGYVGYNYPLWEKQLEMEVNQMRKDRGLPPLIRTGETFGSGLAPGPADK